MKIEKMIEQIRKEYSYQRGDGSHGLRLAGMRQIVDLLYGPFPHQMEVHWSPEDKAIKAMLWLGYSDPASAVVEICHLSEHQIAGDPFWESMPTKKLEMIAEARLYRKAFPLVFGGDYTESEGWVTDIGKKPQATAKEADPKSSADMDLVWEKI